MKTWGNRLAEKCQRIFQEFFENDKNFEAISFSYSYNIKKKKLYDNNGTGSLFGPLDSLLRFVDSLPGFLGYLGV